MPSDSVNLIMSVSDFQSASLRVVTIAHLNLGTEKPKNWLHEFDVWEEGEKT